MDELSDDLKKLEESKNLDLSKFIDFLLKTFPIKHKKNFKWPKVVPGNERKVCILVFSRLPNNRPVPGKQSS